jgi:AcrR family transcriptional regulator
MPSATKDRIMEATGELFRRYGYTGTGLKQIVAEANAPFGSIYHFFPDGKEHLGEEVIRRQGRMYGELFAEIVGPADDPAAGVSDWFEGAAELLRETDYADACPIATVALEVANVSEPLRKATADVFESWIHAGMAYLAAAGVDEGRARELAIEVIAAMEGAFVLCRATRSTEALEVAGAAAAKSVKAELPA